jgi:hypothetical protein
MFAALVLLLSIGLASAARQTSEVVEELSMGSGMILPGFGIIVLLASIQLMFAPAKSLAQMFPSFTSADRGHRVACYAMWQLGVFEYAIFIGLSSVFFGFSANQGLLVFMIASHCLFQYLYTMIAKTTGALSALLLQSLTPVNPPPQRRNPPHP